eukprot:TRINITY_DN3120_c0_g1_i1.p2 TRINITY_DN3120_c0_g1~~TRINITY_DN3120_c0_g1_i1.p2  ORF type:complete len:56 (-),score=0.95 TRINITY_DN3120_c0_g1_i1:103-270(-)
MASGHPISVHGWICDIATGLVTDLRVDESDQWQKIQSIYRLDFPEFGCPHDHDEA